MTRRFSYYIKLFCMFSITVTLITAIDDTNKQLSERVLVMEKRIDNVERWNKQNFDKERNRIQDKINVLNEIIDSYRARN